MSSFLTAEWRKLIMAQYEVAPATLAPWLPRGVELDLYKDSGAPETPARCCVSLVGFLFDRVRVKGLAVPFHTRFEEVNLRFYVRRTDADGALRRGVVFIREFVPRAAIAVVARTLYEEPYLTLPTRSSIVHSPGSLGVEYAWNHQRRWHSLAVEASPDQQSIAPNSEEEFLTEHYWGYTRRRNGTTSEYGVRHPRWNIYPISSHKIDVDLGALYGPAFAHLDAQRPSSVLLAEGSAVSVLSGATLKA
jgi:uncharacterized protein YqjF (DUF2071 family)